MTIMTMAHDYENFGKVLTIRRTEEPETVMAKYETILELLKNNEEFINGNIRVKHSICTVELMFFKDRMKSKDFEGIAEALSIMNLIEDDNYD